jgi:hypothetical protein
VGKGVKRVKKEEGVCVGGCSVASTDGVFDVFCLLVMFGVVLLLVLQV